jgi:ubiquinone/menaquinone biosynthesis C-methylase UbiE
LEATGIDYVPSAIEAARSKGVEGVTYVVGDATDLAGAGLPTFDFFFDVGCFQGFDADQRNAVGRGV